MSERKGVLVEAWSEFCLFLALNLSDWNSILLYMGQYNTCSIASLCIAILGVLL